MAHCKGYLKEKNPELYSTWAGMKTRCTNKKAANYGRYGGKGVKFCDGFKSFLNFKLIVGEKPSKEYSLDRIKGCLHYSCGECIDCINNGWDMNVKWSTAREQSTNRNSFVNIIEFNGEKHTLQQWADKLGIKRPTLNYRVNTVKWSVEKSLTTPINKKYINNVNNTTT